MVGAAVEFQGPHRKGARALEEIDGDYIRLMFEAETQLPLGTAFPLAARNDEVVASRFFTERADTVKSRLAPLLESKDITAPKCSLKKACYKFTFGTKDDDEENLIKEITHVASGVSVECPDHTRLTKEFIFTNSHLDGAAQLEKRPVVQMLSGFFDQGEAFLEHIVGKKAKKSLNDLAERIKREKDTRSQELQEASVMASGNVGILKHAANKLKMEVTNAARQKMLEKVKKKNLKREVSVSGVRAVVH